MGLKPFGAQARRALCVGRVTTLITMQPAGLPVSTKEQLNLLFAAPGPVVQHSHKHNNRNRRGSISDEAAAIAKGRRGSVLAQAGLLAQKKFGAKQPQDERKGLLDPADRTGVLHSSGTSGGLLTRSIAEVTERVGFLFEHDYSKMLKETGYNRVELYDLFMQFKALLALSQSEKGVDRDTFIAHTPMLSMEDPAFVGKVFDLLDTDGSRTIDWEEYLLAMNILSSNVAVPSTAASAQAEGAPASPARSRKDSIDVEALLETLHQAEAVDAAQERPATPPPEEAPEGLFGDLGKKLQQRPLRRQATVRMTRPTDAMSQRQAMAEFLFKCYDADGGGVITEEEFFESLMASFYVDKASAEHKYAVLTARRAAAEAKIARRAFERASRASPSSHDDEQRMYAQEQATGTVEEQQQEQNQDDRDSEDSDESDDERLYRGPDAIAHAYCAEKFGRTAPFGDLDADTVAVFRDVVKRTFALIDDNDSGSISCREAVAYVTHHPELLDVCAIFGRSMLSTTECDIKHLVQAKKEEKEKQGYVPPAELERRRAALFESLYRGEHVQRDKDGIPVQGAPVSSSSTSRSTRSPPHKGAKSPRR